MCIRDRIYFNQRIPLRFVKGGLYLVRSPWQLLIEPQTPIWESANTHCENAKRRSMWGDGDIWTLTVCDSDTPGSRYGKCLMQCSREQVANEVWHQIVQSRQELRYALADCDIGTVRPRYIHVWDAYVDVGGREGGEGMRATEPKSSPNAGTLALRPPAQSDLSNLIFGAAYAQNSREMLLMDSAAECGVRAARQIVSNCASTHQQCARFNAAWPSVTLKPRSNAWLFGPLRSLDNFLFECGLPHVCNLTGFGESGAAWVLVAFFLALIAILVLAAYLVWRLSTLSTPRATNDVVANKRDTVSSTSSVVCLEKA